MKIKVVLVSILVLTLGSCRDPQSLDEYVTNEWHDYSISPETILQDISIGGEKEVFILQDSDKQNEDLSSFASGLPFSDYITILDSFYSQIIGAELSSYQIVSMQLYRKCSNKIGMFDEFHISTFIEDYEGETPYRIEFFVNISSSTKTVEMMKSKFTNLKNKWVPVYPLDNVLSINEVDELFWANSRKHITSTDRQECSVRFYYDQEPYWFASITQEGIKDYVFSLWINSQDGSFQKENPFQNNN